MNSGHLYLKVEFTSLCVLTFSLLFSKSNPVSAGPHLKGRMTYLSFLSCLFNCSAVMGPALIPNLGIS